MEISMWMIAECLKQYRCTTDIQKGARTIKSVRFLYQLDSNPPSETVFICALKELTDDKTKDGVIVVNLTDTIVVHNANQEKVLNEILSLIEHCNSWEERMKRILDHNGSLGEIVNCISDLVPASILVFERGGRICASAISDERIHDFLYATSTGTNFRTQYMSIIIGKHIPYGKRTSTYIPELSLCVRHLYDGMSWVGDLLIDARGIISSCQKQFTDRIGCFLDEWISVNKDRKILLEGSSAILSLVVSDPDPYVLEDFQAFLDTREIKSCSTKRFVIIRCKDTINAQKIFDYISKTYHNLLVTILECDVLLLINCDAFDSLDFEFLKDSIVSSFSCHYGISCPFFDLGDAQQAFIQASLAADAFNSSRLNDVTNTLPVYLADTMKRVTSSTLEMQPISLLRKYDEENHTELLDTLRIYLLSERKQKQTADYFGVHRNTITYRLNQISEITQLDLDNTLTRVSLILNFILMDGGNIPEIRSSD